jgi:hypothetical protein
MHAETLLHKATYYSKTMLKHAKQFWHYIGSFDHICYFFLFLSLLTNVINAPFPFIFRRLS